MICFVLVVDGDPRDPAFPDRLVLHDHLAGYLIPLDDGKVGPLGFQGLPGDRGLLISTQLVNQEIEEQLGG